METFKLNFKDNWAKKGQTIMCNNGTFVVTSAPKRKWHKMLLQYITFGIYKAPYTYSLKPYTGTSGIVYTFENV